MGVTINSTAFFIPMMKNVYFRIYDTPAVVVEDSKSLAEGLQQVSTFKNIYYYILYILN